MEKETKEKNGIKIKKEEKGMEMPSKILIMLSIIVACLTILTIATTFFLKLGECFI